MWYHGVILKNWHVLQTEGRQFALTQLVDEMLRSLLAKTNQKSGCTRIDIEN
jgi:hypothetical protein